MLVCVLLCVVFRGNSLSIVLIQLFMFSSSFDDRENAKVSLYTLISNIEDFAFVEILCLSINVIGNKWFFLNGFIIEKLYLNKKNGYENGMFQVGIRVLIEQIGGTLV